MVDHVAFLDLETAGTDEVWDQILEVGVILTDVEFQPIRSFTAVAEYQFPSDPKCVQGPKQVVLDMHKANGLWDDCAGPGAVPLEEIDRQLAQWLKETTGSTRMIALAGSGVGHFDSRFIRQQMPETAKRFTFWTLDVGVVRRFLSFAQAGMEYPNPNERKNHRALDDARLHLEESQHYLQMFRQMQAVYPTWGVAS